jgi:hypothetical protein
MKIKIHTLESLKETFGETNVILITSPSTGQLHAKIAATLQRPPVVNSIAPLMFGRIFEVVEHQSVNQSQKFMTYDRENNRTWTIEDWMIDQVLDESAIVDQIDQLMFKAGYSS